MKLRDCARRSGHAKIIGIYVIRNMVTGKIYVGQSRDVISRVATHRARLNRGAHNNSYLQSSWVRHGMDAFEFEVVDECPPGELNAREEFFIETFDSCNPAKGYNQSKSAAGGVKPTGERNKRISEALKGRKLTDEHRKNMSRTQSAPDAVARKVAYMTGRPASPETREKIRQSKLGRKASEEDRRKMSDAHKGIPFSPERKAKVSDTIRAMSASLTPEQKKARSQRAWETRRRNATATAVNE